MKISDLAKQYNTNSDFILKTIKSLKLKAKDPDQELNVVVLSVVKGHLDSLEGKFPPPEEEKPLVAETPAAQEQKELSGAAGSEDAGSGEEEEKKKSAKKAAKKTAKTSAAKMKEEPKEPESKEKTTARKGKKASPSKSAEKSADVASQEEGGVSSVKDATISKPAKRKKIIGDQPIITLKPFGRKKKKTLSHAEETQEVKSLHLESVAVPADEDKGKSSAVAEVPEVSAELIDIELKIPIMVKDLASRIQQKSSVVLKELMGMGLFCHINQTLDEEIVRAILKKFGYALAKIKTDEEQLVEMHEEEKDDPALLKPRPPVVTLMGHVDHGKTSLLDRFRQSNVVDQEHGGITQHMGAYAVKMPKGVITFLDTPGHEAFTSMRARGAHITDLVIIVIAADEGIMPQTQEAIDHAQAANVPIVIALNKMDRPGADPDRVKKQLSEINLMPEDWGGKTIVVPVSAKTGDGVNALLEMMLLEAEMLELKANPDRSASGIVVEAHLSQGKGAVSTLIVQRGTLKEGDVVVIGQFYGRVKAMFDDRHKRMISAGPSIPVEVLGLAGVPDAGEKFYVVDDERKAKEIAQQRAEKLTEQRRNSAQKITLENLYAHLQEGMMKELNVILKADAQGSVEAIKDSLAKIPKDKVRMRFIHAGVGVVNSSDVVLAQASDAVIMAFNVGVDQRAKVDLEHQPVDIREYRIIYDLVEDMHKAMEGMLEAKVVKNFLARIEVREVFKLSKSGVVAGCYVLKGKAPRKAKVDVIRDKEIVFSGSLSSLKRFKEDVKEVTEGMECGLTIAGFNQYQTGDVFEIYEEQKVAQRL